MILDQSNHHREVKALLSSKPPWVGTSVNDLARSSKKT
jgi:hypothetical protein